MDVPTSSRGLAELPHSLHHAGRVQEFFKKRRAKMNRGPLARIILAVIFFALVLCPWAIKRWSTRRDAAAANIDNQTALSRHGFYFQEVAHAVGVNFVHQAPTLDHQLDHVMPQVASMGAAV